MLIALSPPPGLNTDDTSFSNQGRWEDGNNVRFVNGKPQCIGGYQQVFSMVNTVGPCVGILPFTRSGVITIAYGFGTSGFGSKLYVGTGLVSPTDRSPASPAATDHWSLDAWGSTLLASPSGGTLYEQSGTSAATEVTQAPDRITYMLVTPERQVLALGCNEEVSTTFNPLCIRGCDLEDYTNWTTSPDNNAFEHILDGAGVIVAARMIGTYVVVWTDTALYLGQFVGDPSQTYRFDLVDGNCGLAGPRAVVIHNQAAYWLGPDKRPRRWTPGSLPEILPCPILNDFLSGIDNTAAQKMVASANARFNEVRFDFSSSTLPAYPPGAGGNNKYIAVCLADGSWHKGTGGRTALLDSGVLSSLTTIYPGAPTAFGCQYDSVNNIFYLHDTGSLTYSGANQQPFITSGGQYLDNSQRRLMVRRLIPDVEDQVGTMYLTLLVSDYPRATPSEKGPYTITTGATKVDFRASGKIIAAKFHGSEGSDTVAFRLGKPVFDTVTQGER